MTKTLLVLALFYGLLMSAQAYPRYSTEHEIKLNMGKFLVNTTIEGSYEYYFTEDTSIGGTMYFNNDASRRNGNFGLGPNLRAYFGFAPKSGFFVEAFGLYYTGEDEIQDNNLGVRNNDYSTMALGLGLGKKWATFNQKFTMEINGGLGRNMNPADFQDAFMYRAGFSLGFRF